MLDLRGGKDASLMLDWQNNWTKTAYVLPGTGSMEGLRTLETFEPFEVAPNSHKETLMRFALLPLGRVTRSGQKVPSTSLLYEATFHVYDTDPGHDLDRLFTKGDMEERVCATLLVDSSTRADAILRVDLQA